MSSDVAIKVEHLSKCYHIYEKPRDRLAQMLLMGRRKFYREFHALLDVSFELKKGETFGIIGRNGSGKSTLLQLICGTLAQSSGSIQTNGRVAALLELGSGFNPEFSGRENVYLNASILGLSREEVDVRYDAIVRFAGIGDHMEQPVKTYSSGMYVRLAFSVIAHVDADILVIDEALAVGDAVFTQKCMRFIRSFREKGTLLFVSHDMNSVLNLCEKVMWLDQGQMRQHGPAKAVAEAYLQHTLQEVYGSEVDLRATGRDSVVEQGHGDTDAPVRDDPPMLDYGARFQPAQRLVEANGWKDGRGEIKRMQLELEDGTIPPIFKGGEIARMVIEAELYEDMMSPILGFLFRDRLGQDLFGENTLPFTAHVACAARAGDRIRAAFLFRMPMLPNGDYAVMASLADGDLYRNVQHHMLHDALVVHVSNSQVRWGLVGVPFYQVKMERVA